MLNVFNIFKFELNPLVNKKKKDIGLNVLFRVSSTYANILKYHIQGTCMPTNNILQVFI
jgi:hypothetical protein